LDEEEFKVLKTLSEVTNRMDVNMFSKKVNLNPTETIEQVQQLARDGFLQKVGNGYGITERGKTALKVLASVAEDMGFQFYFAYGKPSDFIVDTLEDFYMVIKQINAESIEFHLYRGDFENWIKEAIQDPHLAYDFGTVRAFGLKGEALRAELLKALDENYNIQELL
jgi:DNA-binding Lrp family transcriptional regulator